MHVSLPYPAQALQGHCQVAKGGPVALADGPRHHCHGGREARAGPDLEGPGRAGKQLGKEQQNQTK